MEEIWKHITGYEDYMISNLGRVKSLKNGKEKILKNLDRGNGYLYVELKKRKKYLVHRLVAQAFLENPENLPQINHKDENPQNNTVENLEWCSSQYNMTYNNKHIKIGRKLAKKIGCFKYGKLIKIYDAIQDVKIDNFLPSKVCLCCKEKRNHHHGFQWAYLN